MIAVIENPTIQRYEIKAPYDPELIELIKGVPGRMWVPEKKVWSIPTARLGFFLSAIKGTRFDAECNVYSTEMINENQTLDATTEIPDIDISDATLYVKEGQHLYNHQIDTLKYAKWRYTHGLPDGFLLADSPGTGKTLSVTNVAMYFKEHFNAKHCLIIACVNSAKYNWQEDIFKHTNGAETPYLLGSRLKRNGELKPEMTTEDKVHDLETLTMYGNNDMPAPYFLLLNIEAFHIKKNRTYPVRNAIINLVNAGELSIIALDEIHRNASMSSTNGQQILEVKKKTDHKVFWIPMTGTPINNKPTDVFLPLRLVGGHYTNNFYGWCDHYCIYGSFGRGDILGYKNLQELKDILQPNMLRRLKEDILDLPPKIHMTEYVNNSPYQTKLYNKVAERLVEDRENILTSLNPMAHFLRLRQISGSPELVDLDLSVDDKSYLSKNAKLKRVLELLDDILADPNEKVILFSNWVEPLRTLHKFISKKYKVAVYTGTMSDADKLKHKKAFLNDPECRIMIGTTGAMGVSHTLTVARNVIFYDLPWNPSDIEQCEDRCHRPGTTDTVNVYMLIAKDTVDERVYELIKDKEHASKFIVDDSLDFHAHPELIDNLLLLKERK